LDVVTAVLIDRTRYTERLSRMVIVSLLLHGTLLTVLTLAPRYWTPASAPNEHVMNISLAGPEGPIQGHNPMAGKQIQEAVPETVKPKNDTPPALEKPEMVENIKTAKPQPKAITKSEPKKDVPQLHGRTPTQGAEVKAGSARVDTQGAPVQFGGLSTGGGMNNAYTDFGDFCCPEYLATMQRLVYRNWQERQGQDGSNIVKFTIRRDGSISDAAIKEGANQFLNLASMRALAQTQRLPPLPTQYSGDKLTVYLVFQYKR
jgi:TonB family protein